MKTKLKIKFNIKNINGYELSPIEDMTYPNGDRINVWFGMLRLETKKGWVDIYGNNSLDIHCSIKDLKDKQGLSIEYDIDNVEYKDFYTKDDSAYIEGNNFSIKYLLDSDEIGSHKFEGEVSLIDVQISQDSFNNYTNRRNLEYLSNDIEIRIGIESIEVIEDSKETLIWVTSDKYQEPELINAFEEN